jgi:hypothetical protein
MHVKSNGIKRGLALAVLSLCLVNVPLVPAHYASAANVKTATVVSKPVYLNAASTIVLRDAQLLMQDQGKVLAFTLTVTNNSNNELDLMDYWVRIKSTSGKNFKTNLIEADKGKTMIAPKSSQNITYYAIVDRQTQLTEIRADIVQWDFNAPPSYERRLGTLSLSSTAVGKVAAFKDKVMLYENTKIRSAVKGIAVNRDGETANLTVNFLLENVGFQSTNLSKAAFQVLTESQTVFDVSTSDLSQLVLQPRERRVVTLHASLPASIAAKPLSLAIAVNDEASKIKVPIGTFALPTAKTISATPTGQQRIVYIAGQPVQTVTTNAFVTENDDKQDISIEYKIENIGTGAVDLPDLDFSLRTKANVYYPLTYDKETDKTLLPKIAKSLVLSGQFPESIQASDLELVVRTTGTDQAKSYGIGNYAIQGTKQQGQVGASFSYQDYDVKLASINRIPLADQDMVAAELVITNKTKDSKGIPSLGGYFLVNGVKIDPAQAVRVGLDQTITIAPNGTYNLVVYTKIPYTTDLGRVTFVLSEWADNKVGKTLYQFGADGIAQLPASPTSKPYEIGNIGKKSSVTVRSTGVFTGTQSDLFYAELELDNKETRSIVPVKLGGLIQNQAGETIPVVISEYTKKLLPNGKVLMSGWAKIPHDFEKTTMKFFIGQAVTTGQGAEVTLDGILKPQVYTINVASTQKTKTDFTNIRFSNYDLTLRRFNTSLNVTGGGYTVEGMRLSFDYDLSINKLYESVAEKHKILIEFVDQESNKTTYSKEFDLDSTAQGELLTEGKAITKEIVFSDPQIQTKIQTYNKYRINVYDVFQDTRLLLASKELKWFATQ